MTIAIHVHDITSAKRKSRDGMNWVDLRAHGGGTFTMFFDTAEQAEHVAAAINMAVLAAGLRDESDHTIEEIEGHAERLVEWAYGIAEDARNERKRREARLSPEMLRGQYVEQNEDVKREAF